MTTVKGVEELVAEFEDYGSIDGFMAVMIALLFFGTVYALEAVGRGIWFRPWFRGLLADYAYPVGPNFLSEGFQLKHQLDRYNFLDWVFACAGRVGAGGHSHPTTYSSILPHC